MSRDVMPIMDTADLRTSFRAFAGQDRYRKFVRTLNRQSRNRRRLLFWQEDLWDEFVAKAPGAPTSQGDILDAFRTCDVHGDDLEPAPSSDPPPEIRHTPEYDRALDTLFPLAAGGDFVCQQCRSERQRWIAENFDLCRILRCKTTYEAYCDRQLGSSPAGPGRDDMIKKRAAEIAAEMQPGDELWEWDTGGWHQLAGRGGIAIVRDGKIVRQWCEVKS
jgi:hypothetical protein